MRSSCALLLAAALMAAPAHAQEAGNAADNAAAAPADPAASSGQPQVADPALSPVPPRTEPIPGNPVGAPAERDRGGGFPWGLLGLLGLIGLLGRNR